MQKGNTSTKRVRIRDLPDRSFMCCHFATATRPYQREETTKQFRDEFSQSQKQSPAALYGFSIRGMSEISFLRFLCFIYDDNTVAIFCAEIGCIHLVKTATLHSLLFVGFRTNLIFRRSLDSMSRLQQNTVALSQAAEEASTQALRCVNLCFGERGVLI